MPRQRSTAVLTVAILHLIGEGLGLFGSLCGGASLLISGGGGEGRLPALPVRAHRVANVAECQAYQVGSLGVGLALDVLLLSACTPSSS